MWFARKMFSSIFRFFQLRLTKVFALEEGCFWLSSIFRSKVSFPRTCVAWPTPEENISWVIMFSDHPNCWNSYAQASGALRRTSSESIGCNSHNYEMFCVSSTEELQNAKHERLYTYTAPNSSFSCHHLHHLQFSRYYLVRNTNKRTVCNDCWEEQCEVQL